MALACHAHGTPQIQNHYMVIINKQIEIWHIGCIVHDESKTRGDSRRPETKAKTQGDTK
jgi:hypothetical protein